MAAANLPFQEQTSPARPRGERWRGRAGAARAFGRAREGKKGLRDNKDFGTDTPAGSQLGGSFPHRYAGIAGLNVLKGLN